MNTDDDDYAEIDPDYGVFGDPGGLIPRRMPMPDTSPRRLAEQEYERRKREHEATVGREFNSYMILLFNEARKRDRT